MLFYKFPDLLLIGLQRYVAVVKIRVGCGHFSYSTSLGLRHAVR